MAGCGPLRAAPRIPRSPACDLGLVPVSVGTWGPFVFANPDPSAEPLADALGDLPAVVAEHDLDVDALRFNRRVRYEIRANWKIALENYLECYHCPVNHPGLVEVIDERRLELVAHGRRTSQFAPVHPHTLEGRGPIDVSDGRRRGAEPPVVPHVEIQRASRPPQPVGGAACSATGHVSARATWTTGSQRAPSEGWIEELFVLDDQVGAEDTALVEAAQRGSRSGMIEHGWVLGGPETLIGHFQDYVRDQLGRHRDECRTGGARPGSAAIW